MSDHIDKPDCEMFRAYLERNVDIAMRLGESRERYYTALKLLDSFLASIKVEAKP